MIMVRLRVLALEADHHLALGLHRLARRSGYRGLALSALATIDLLWAWSLWDSKTAQPVLAAPAFGVIVKFGAWFDPSRPLLPWAILLGLVGLLCGWQVWVDDDRAAYAAAVIIKVLWVILILSAWPDAGTQIVRAAGQWVCLAILVAACAGGIPYRRD